MGAVGAALVLDRANQDRHFLRAESTRYRLAIRNFCTYTMWAMRIGRPRKKCNEKRQERLNIRLTVAEKRAFQLAADQANQDLSAWIRIQLHQAATAASSDSDLELAQEKNVNHGQANSDRTDSLR